MAEQTFDAHRASEQKSRFAAAGAIGFNALRPFMQFQASLLRLWANNAELIARNYEQQLENFGSAVEKKARQQEAA